MVDDPLEFEYCPSLVVDHCWLFSTVCCFPLLVVDHEVVLLTSLIKKACKENLNLGLSVCMFHINLAVTGVYSDQSRGNITEITVIDILADVVAAQWSRQADLTTM